jgi:hypothetical protein
MAPSESLAYRQLLLSRERKAFAPQDDEALRHSSSSQNQRLKHRKKMSFFMLEACEELDIDNSTAFTAVAFFDRIMKEQRVVTSKIEVVALCCVLVAAKFDLDDDEPSFEDLNSVAFKNYSDGKLEKMEQFVLSSLGFELCVVTPSSFLDCYLEHGQPLFAGVDLKTERRSKGFLEYFAKLYALEYTSTSYRPSVAAAAILHVSRCAGSNGVLQGWPEEIRDLTGVSEYTFADLSASLWGRYIEHCPNAASYAYKPHMLKEATSKNSFSQRPHVLQRKPLASKFSTTKATTPKSQNSRPSARKPDAKERTEAKWPVAMATLGAALVPPSLLISAAIVLASHSSPPLISDAHSPQAINTTLDSPSPLTQIGEAAGPGAAGLGLSLCHCNCGDGLLATYLDHHNPQQCCTRESHARWETTQERQQRPSTNTDMNNNNDNNSYHKSLDTETAAHHTHWEHSIQLSQWPGDRERWHCAHCITNTAGTLKLGSFPPRGSSKDADKCFDRCKRQQEGRAAPTEHKEAARLQVDDAHEMHYPLLGTAGIAAAAA